MPSSIEMVVAYKKLPLDIAGLLENFLKSENDVELEILAAKIKALQDEIIRSGSRSSG